MSRTAIIGIGNELNGDDAAGVLVARALQQLVSDRKPIPGFRSDHLLVIDAGPSPEAFTGPLRRFQPDLIIMVDAAELGDPPGATRWFEWDAAEGMSASTHTLSPTVLSRFLVGELQCRIELLGIQPKSLDFDRDVSVEVQDAIKRVIAELEEKFLQIGGSNARNVSSDEG